MFTLLNPVRRYTEGKFWFLYTFSESLLVLDCVTTFFILEFCGGVELNPFVNSFGLFNITIYKLLANAFVGFVSFKKKLLWILMGISVIFSFVVVWNTLNILWAL